MADETKKKFFTLPNVSLGLGLSTLGGWGLLDPDTFKSFVSAAWKEELIKMMVAFTVAGIIHRFIFRKDIEKQLLKIVTPIVDALNNIADRSAQTEVKLSDMGNKLTEHTNRITLIEQHITPRGT